ncbi:hypothetical protein [Thalassospira xiamenensis]|uniref:Uncharacterized protein n=1 Tax=Thalassospira xiamenensis TaxID=220697 RepID=A0A285TU95_9PROT|nr:hypothetical protein [Thalassospira xiamenensis]SOC27425.1 hypothetical protein SAMN05428964_105412 [Thalassospira xiamenensis]
MNFSTAQIETMAEAIYIQRSSRAGRECAGWAKRLKQDRDDTREEVMAAVLSIGCTIEGKASMLDVLTTTFDCERAENMPE